MIQSEKPVTMVIRLTMNGTTIRRFAADGNEATKAAIQMLKDYPSLVIGDTLSVVAFPERTVARAPALDAPYGRRSSYFSSPGIVGCLSGIWKDGC